ncbi:hypothetical protein RhiirB3_454886 [Rhizophagus irregularis]|nr:hypothetical protein RhiirB3_454886 [Rhizophagus irregularis]
MLCLGDEVPWQIAYSIGAAVPGLSKLHMYQFWYDYVKAVYDEKAFLCYICYMDTDSFVETENIYDDMIKNADLFDFNNYSW